MSEIEENIEWEEKAWEQIEKLNQETLENLKPNEACFGSMVYYTVDKKEADEATAIVSYHDDDLHILWTESDEEIIEYYIKEELGDKAPRGTYFIKFWTKDENSSFEYDEWDIVYSVNFEVEIFSDLTFERALRSIKTQKEIIKSLIKARDVFDKNCTILEKENEKFKNFVKGYMFDVNCVNWFERFVDVFEKWKQEITTNEDKYKKALEVIKNCLSEEYKNFSVSDYVEIKNVINEVLEVKKEG